MIKKKYSNEDFSVPHVHRKDILRQIETKFIARSEDYYECNNFNDRFTHWWNDLKEPMELTIESDVQTLFNSVIDDNENFWLVSEFPQGVMMYKSKLKPALHLISIGLTRTNTFHAIHMKHAFMISIRLTDSKLSVKVSGNDQFKERIKRATF